jgi:hypothetical protein
MGGITKRQRELLKAAREIHPIAYLEPTRGNQFRIVFEGPLATKVVICAKTPGDHRDMKNLRRDMRRAARDAGLIEDTRR